MENVSTHHAHNIKMGRVQRTFTKMAAAQRTQKLSQRLEMSKLRHRLKMTQDVQTSLWYKNLLTTKKMTSQGTPRDTQLSKVHWLEDFGFFGCRVAFGVPEAWRYVWNGEHSKRTFKSCFKIAEIRWWVN